MSYFNKQSRNPLLNTIRKAFFISQESKRFNTSKEELTQQYPEDVERRRFIANTMKAGIAVGAAGFLNACKKAADFMPEETKSGTVKLKSSGPSIAILGAGMAGLNCAYQLKKAGYNATVYEAAPRTGGRIFTKADLLAKGTYTELGGEYIDTEHKDMLKLCHEFGLPLIDTLSKEESAYERDSFFIDGKFYSEEEVINAFEPYASKIAADIRSLPAVMTYDNHNAATLHFDNLSITDYLDSIGMTGFIREGIEVAYLTEYGLENNLQSSINFLYLFSAKTSQGLQIFGSSDERYKIEGGNQTLTNALYEQVKKNVVLEHKLISITENVIGYSLQFEKGNGSKTTIKADIVVCTIPFSVLREVTLNVKLPKWKTNAIQNLGYGTNSKLLLGFKEKVWRKYQYAGYMFSDQQIQTGWDNMTGQNTSKGGFTVYQGGDKGVALGDGTADSQAPKFLDQLEQMWPGCKNAFNGTAKRMHWPAYPHTKGSYACYKVGQYTTIRGAEIKPVGNLFFAGEHCSSYFQGFMNGAAETGRMAAEEVVKVAKKVDAVVVK